MTLKDSKTINNMTTGNDFYTKNRDVDFYNFFEIKAEKLVTATYMITNFLSDKEPMKWKLREACLSMLSDVSVLKDKNTQERSDIFVRVLSIVGEILSLLEIARLSGFISEMNYSVLKREYVFIKKQIELRKEIKGSLGKLTFSENFFDTPERYTLPATSSDRSDPASAGAKRSYNQNNLPEDHVDKNLQKEAHHEMSYNDQKDNFLSDKLSYKDNVSSVRSGNGNVCPLPRANVARDKRREIILQVLKDKKELTIKDISLKITDCSEKTIQRELVSMLRSGVLKKTGERRWSKYSLV